MKVSLLAFAALFALSLLSFGQKMQTPAGEAPGPWLLGTIGIGKQPDGTMKTTALKGLAIKVGEHGEAAVAYDLDLCRMAGAWTGKFTTPMNLMSRGEYPTAMGEVAFTTGEVAGFESGADLQSVADGSRIANPRHFADPRSEPFGPLPPGQARFRGFYVNGDKTILKRDIGGVEVLEMPGFEVRDGLGVFTRTLAIAACDRSIMIYVGERPGAVGFDDGLDRTTGGATTNSAVNVSWCVTHTPDRVHVTGVQVSWLNILKLADRIFPEFVLPGQPAALCPIVLEVPPSSSVRSIRVSYSQSPDQQKMRSFGETLFEWCTTHPVPVLTSLISGGPARWPEPVVTTGELSKDTESAYVVDTIKLPDPNPWGAPMFVGGFDFFPDGRAAVCTFHGDVFVVSGLSDSLEKVTWKRFATGLYHALGLKIVNGEIYVTCRDGIWRLKDLNGDGEADFYEAFNFDVKVTKSFHEFVFDLQTDPAGNFYFAKAGPVKNGGRGFDQIMAHHGSLFRVSPDGKKFDVIATGFRAPNGLGMGPHGELTSGDNEGTWTPVCRLNWITPGGFYGVVPLSHRDPLPTSYDPPLCWLPKRVDNSSGSQVWAPEGERWGPWSGKMLHLSYGQAALYGVLFEKNKDDVMQGGVTKFPLQFQSGIMRARFNPVDGQLYVAGLRGWQTNGLKNGCFQRVRYTGAEPRMPIELHVKKDGIELHFTNSLDTQSARDPENWHLEQWRYLWSAAYGSPELSTETDPEAPAEAGNDGAAQFTKAQMSVAKHDPVTVKSVTIGTDDRTVFLEIPGLKPVMQMSIKYDLKTADGKELRGEVVNTINALGSE